MRRRTRPARRRGRRRAARTGAAPRRRCGARRARTTGRCRRRGHVRQTRAHQHAGSAGVLTTPLLAWWRSSGGGLGGRTVDPSITAPHATNRRNHMSSTLTPTRPTVAAIGAPRLVPAGRAGIRPPQRPLGLVGRRRRCRRHRRHAAHRRPGRGVGGRRDARSRPSARSSERRTRSASSPASSPSSRRCSRRPGGGDGRASGPPTTSPPGWCRRRSRPAPER